MEKKVQIKVRQGIAGDLGILRKLNEKLFIEEAGRGHDDALDISWPLSKRGERYYRKSLMGPHKAVFLAEVKNRTVGYLIVSAKNKHSWRRVRVGELENIFIEAGYRRKGIGKLLISTAFGWLKFKRIQRVFVSAYSQNEKAISFYRNCGFSGWEVGLEARL